MFLLLEYRVSVEEVVQSHEPVVVVEQILEMGAEEVCDHPGMVAACQNVKKTQVDHHHRAVALEAEAVEVDQELCLQLLDSVMMVLGDLLMRICQHRGAEEAPET